MHLFSLFLFLLWSLSMTIVFFVMNSHHKTLIGSWAANMEGLIGYICIIGLLYVGYKYIAHRDKTTIRYSFWHIVGFFVLQLLTVCILYTTSIPPGTLIGVSGAIAPFILFSHILSLLIFPVFLVFLWRAVGFTTLYMWKSWQNHPFRLRVLAETALGMGIFGTGLLILGGMAQYTLSGLLIVTSILTVISFWGWKEIYLDIKNRAIEWNVSQKNSPSVWSIISAEIFFLLFGFVLSVSLINAIRPMPIGWDDLGVYMNFPRIMALSGEYLLGAGMYTWQLVTGTGFLFNNNAAQAFIINQIGGVLATIALIASISLLIENPKSKYSISIPMMIGTIYYIMPMTIFQQAKDQKLDPILMFVSIAAAMLLIYGIRRLIEYYKHDNTPQNTAEDAQTHQNQTLGYVSIFLAGILVGVAFGIKFTTLMFIISSIGLISYRFLGLAGFIGWIGMFIAIFTQAGFWGKLFVWMPADTTVIVYGSTIVAILGIGYGLWKEQVRLTWLYAVMAFVCGVGIALSPWLIKNGVESNVLTTKSIDGLLNGSGGHFLPEYTKNYSEEELQKRHQAMAEFSLVSSSGTTLNEDFSRYFGQEQGLNNYMKLPIHLTIQKNQGGEFTNITFLFLALVPVILFFLPVTPNRRRLWITSLGILLGIGAIIALNVTTSGSSFAWLTPFLASIGLPEGYLVLIGLVLFFAIIAHVSIDEKHPLGKNAKDILFFLLLYGLIFWISGFGIVWYGILIYFFFLAIIAIGTASLTIKDTVVHRFQTIVVITITTLVGIYWFFGALPHSWINLQSAGYNDYKYKVIDQDTAIFLYRSEYFVPIAALNTTSTESAIRAMIDASGDIPLTYESIQNTSLEDIHYTLIGLYQQIISSMRSTPIPPADLKKQMSDVNNMMHALYSSVLYPNKEIANTEKIYRIGTFMTYLIHKNRARYYDDSLVTGFETYFYDKNPETTITRMRNIGIKHLLVDLNAATIDRDPRRALTTRYEHLLATMRANNLKLIATDNACLQFALHLWENNEISTVEDFVSLAGTNYESYAQDESGNPVIITRGMKQNECANRLIASVHAGKSLPQTWPLRNIIYNIEQASQYQDNKNAYQQALSHAVAPLGMSYFALFEVLDTPQ